METHFDWGTLSLAVSPMRKSAIQSAKTSPVFSKKMKSEIVWPCHENHWPSESHPARHREAEEKEAGKEDAGHTMSTKLTGLPRDPSDNKGLAKRQRKPSEH